MALWRSSSVTCSLFFSLVCTLIIITPLEVVVLSADDGLTLMAMKDQLTLAPAAGDQEEPSKLYSWNQSLHFCEWPGVICGRRHKNRVVGLTLANSALAGTIPPHIANLSFLSYIDLSENSLHGHIPAEMGRLFRLKYLGLSNNSLQGEIPTNLSSCSELEVVSLARNHLEGNIPPQLGGHYIPHLQILSLAGNALTGTIPASLGNLSRLILLSLSKNSLSGSIPNELGRLVNLQFFHADLNHLSGQIPPSLFNLSSLTDIVLLHNNLHGDLPLDPGFTRLPNLRKIFVDSNSLSGRIPPSLSNLSSLEMLHLGRNSFSGPIPANLGRLQSLRIFRVYRNKLQNEDGDDQLSFLRELTNCSCLEELNILDNHFTGRFPDSIVSNFSSNLRNLILESNPIHGNMPKEIGNNLENLEVLNLQNMSLTGEIPTDIGKLKKLKILLLGRNGFSGIIPPSIGNITGLNLLYLNKNGLQGHIPSSFGNFQDLLELNLSHNALTGPIPRQVFSISSLSILLDMSNNALSGLIPKEVGNLENIGNIDISNNQFSGEIPSTLSNCLALEHLHISGNLLNGSIPSSLSTLRGMVTLALQSNNLSGEIPDYLGDFTFLGYLNLSFNKLQGKVPEKGIFRNATAISVVGNEKLCGGIKELHLPACSGTQALDHKNRGNLKKRLVMVSGVIIFLVLFIVLMSLVYYYWRRRITTRRKPVSLSSRIEDQFRTVGYRDLLNATDGFSPSNLIGQGSYGSVYKGVLFEDGDNEEDHERRVLMDVAVKVLNLENGGASKSFLAECEALRSIRHRNLVKIITVCSSIDYEGNDFKALVFAYLPNGSLETWLHPKQEGPAYSDHDQMRNLTITERLNIAIDVASALEYLHYHCDTPIVHRDVKPSNVLLDNDMNAFLGDFGIAKFLSDDAARSKTTTSIKGTIGYIAPEYGLDEKVTTQGDVYSYGILLLEIFTGKRPTEEMFTNGLSLHQFVRMALPEYPHPERLETIVDPTLLFLSDDAASSSYRGSAPPKNSSRYNKEMCLLSVLRIGLNCSEELPSKRMVMSRVVSELLSIRDKYMGTGIHGK